MLEETLQSWQRCSLGLRHMFVLWFVVGFFFIICTCIYVRVVFVYFFSPKFVLINAFEFVFVLFCRNVYLLLCLNLYLYLSKLVLAIVFKIVFFCRNVYLHLCLNLYLYLPKFVFAFVFEVVVAFVGRKGAGCNDSCGARKPAPISKPALLWCDLRNF